MAAPLIKLRGLSRDFPMGDHVVHALRDVDLDIDQGEITAIMGSSGSGKSTLLHLVGCLDRPTAGTYELDGEQVSELSPRQLALIRRHKIGFVFQSFHLVARLTTAQNVELPMLFAGIAPAERQRRVSDALEAVALADRAGHRPDQLSGGQRQRAAIARSIVGDPELVLADEPTGNLDTETGEEILHVLTSLHQRGRTVILVTHDTHVAACADRIIHMQDGRVVRDERHGKRHEEEFVLEG